MCYILIRGTAHLMIFCRLCNAGGVTRSSRRFLLVSNPVNEIGTSCGKDLSKNALFMLGISIVRGFVRKGMTKETVAL